MMKRFYFLLLALVFSGLSSYCQMYILNEDFSGAGGTTPPGGWSNTVITGNATDLWHFDNPGNRIINYPVTAPFAIFDSEVISGNGAPEAVALETPFFDASISNFILLNFQHTFAAGTGNSGTIEAFDGNAWQVVTTYSAPTLNPSTEILDLSSIAGGVTNARLRFTWSGNGSGYWAVDNIRIYASLPLDGGLVSVDSPQSPVVPGVQDVAVTFGNFGYTTITSTTFNWTADGIPQAPYSWNGSAAFGQTISGIVIGTYNFQDPVELKVWQTGPNGQADPNPYNDTISEYLVSPLCGTYTIGGSDPDFESFSEVAFVLNNAGVTCPVTFLVRDGFYYDQFMLGDIPGASSASTVTFRSESGDSSLAVLKIAPGAVKYESMIFLNGTRHVRFQDLGLFTGSAVSFANNAVRMEGAEDILIQGCYFQVKNQFDYGALIQEGSHNVEISLSRFESVSARAGAVHITGSSTRDVKVVGNNIEGATDWGYTTIRIAEGAGNILVSGNLIERCFRAVYLSGADSVSITKNRIGNSNDGIYLENLSNATVISGNRITGINFHQNVPEGTSGITVKNASETFIFNNFIQTAGNGPVMGISLLNATFSGVYFNSINITSTDPQDRSKGLLLAGSSNVVAYNNIFSIESSGTPVYIDAFSPPIDFNRNDYYGFDQRVGFYNGILYTSLQSWQNSTGMDANSHAVIPFFTSRTDLSINQALLNNAGVPVSGITVDIDGTSRNPVNPDIGAKEYSPCPIDAGINAILSPQNPLPSGTLPVRVQLQNQGMAALTSANIHWEVNDQVQAVFPWSGNLLAGANEEVVIGNFNFLAGELYVIRAWTTDPNNTADCNPFNDTIYSPELAGPLCGTYTIGGISPDFSSISQAVNILNLAGISCSVTFLVRDGVYSEQFSIGDVPGTSATSTVTFRSETGDSTSAVIRIVPEAQNFEPMIYLAGSHHLRFMDLGLFTGSEAGNNNTALVLDGATDIQVEGCFFELHEDSDLGIAIRGGSSGIRISGSRMDCIDPRAWAIDLSGEGTRDIEIDGNQVLGTTEFGFLTIRIGTGSRQVNFTGNQVERCYRAVNLIGTDSVQVRGNIIKNSSFGVFADDQCTEVEISGNRFIGITSHEDVPDGTACIFVRNVSGSHIFNNFLHTTGNGPVIGISLQNVTACRVHFNSLNLTNSDPQARSKGLFLNGNSQVTARNNIFHLAYAGTPVYIQDTAADPDFDRNNYHSYNQSVGYFNGTTYSDLEQWADALDMDRNSLSTEPFYTSETDLSINQALLNNTGTPVAGITQDIDGVTRDAVHPDIGAKEYDPCAVDAGVNEILSPVNPLTGGMQPVIVRLQNQGIQPLTSAMINWQVNGMAQAAFNWSGNLPAGANADVQAGEFDFLSGKLYLIKAWTTGPNGASDCNHENDTSLSHELAAPLCGTYTIGGSNPDFATLGQAATVLNVAGIKCPVTFLVRDGTYYEQFSMLQVPGSSDVNTVTFRSESGDSTRAMIRIIPDALKFESMAILDGTRYVRFEKLGFATGTDEGTSNNAILLKGAQQIGFTGCYFEVARESDIALSFTEESHGITVAGSRFECTDPRAGAVNIAGEGTREIEIAGNAISGSASKGNTLVRIGNGTLKISLTGNMMQNCYRAVYMFAADSIGVTGNTILNSNDGIYIDNLCSGIDVSANRLINISSHPNAPDGTSGILAKNSTGISIVNNFIHTIGAGPVLGINLQHSDSCRIHYNSVNVTNVDVQARSKGFYVTETDQVQFRNNIFSVKTDGIPVHIGANVTGMNPDYNDYYHPSGMIGKIGNTVYTNLFEWGQTVNGDANSKNVNPYFKADADPVPFQRALNGAGIPIPGILFDIDGKLRFAQAPDIGCIEFFVDYGVLDLLSPDLNCFHDETDSVTVYLRMFGDVPFNDLKVAYRLDDGPVHIDTIPGPVFGDVIHTFETVENISAEGDYLFTIWLIGTLDDNINNDTLYAWRYSKPSPVVTIDYDNFCTGWKVSFFGSATVVAPYYIASYEWLFGDDSTSLVQNPVHVYHTPGTYAVTLRAYSDAGCYGFTTMEVFIDPEFQGLSMGYNLINETCYRDSTGSLEIIPAGGYPPYSVFLNDQPVSNNLITGLTTGTYVIRIVDSENCTVTDTVESFSAVNLDPLIEADPLSGMTPLSVDFSFTANDPASWIWFFPDSDFIDTDTSRTPSYTFLDYGIHRVILEVTGGHPYYCVERDTVEIFVDIKVTIDVNNVFTPNDDGYNDFFEIRTVAVRALNAGIFNRWGNKVYEIDEVNGKWDGRTEGGTDLPDGTYFYSIEAIGYDDVLYERQGSVLLLRHAARGVPNPVRDNLKVLVYGPIEAPVSYSIYSVYGTLVRSGSLNDPGNIVIDMSGLGNGVYVVKVNDDRESYFVRIIKN